ncbi:LytR/AlgR family response regulator transcription factor [Parapedobacter koreensis]|uniref:Two component transcriptional regulator, LytTR family n=1 Tax=Parapedobacter koreensis TaxID=332977 RepID=A0A1H7FY24_9SPHI|nr:LytTR family DNA-binding domain-containing protein [Parapedobacter koreensis]SEK30801.1 two component transcriptional regulator, LytTR family [Parapedobacter koreensis]
MALRSIIVDDEASGRQNLRNLLTTYCPDVAIEGEAASVTEALLAANRLQPELLFLDIELPDGTGFDLLQSLNGSHDFEVVFVTAYDQYGIQAAKACAVDYLLKPIHIVELMKAVEKAKAYVTRKQENLRLKELVANMDRQPNEKRIALPLSDKIEFIRIQHIIRLEAEGNYTHFYLHHGAHFLVCKTLKEYHELLEPQGFIRTHQSHLINRNKISSYVKTDGGYITMEDGSQVPIARKKKDDITRLFSP